MDRTEALMAEIARAGSTRLSIASVYATGIRAHTTTQGSADFVDWPTVNGALLKRYTMSGLTFIKAEAWKMAFPKPESR